MVERAPQANKKKGLSTGAKIALGIAGTAATIYAGVVTHRFIKRPNFDKVQKNFSEILGRNLSESETNALINKYKEIAKIEKTDDFLQKLFEEVKKDYGFEDMDIKLVVEKLKDGSFKTFNKHHINGSAGAVNKEISIYPKTHRETLVSDLRQKAFGTMMHEMHHIRQDLIAYRTSPEKTLDAYMKRLEKCEDWIVQTMKENSCSRKEVLDEARKDIKKNLDELFGKYSRYSANSPEYNKGLEYIENIANYTREGDAYFKQIKEKEAFEITDKAKKIFDYVANPWRVF